MQLEQLQPAVDGLGQAELTHQEVHGPDAAVADATAAVADLLVDVAGRKHGLGAAAQVTLVQAFLHPLLATGQLVAYSGVHSKSLHHWGDEHSVNTHQTPEMPKDFEFSHELHAAWDNGFA
jgi:hypothetical protein